MTPEDFLENHLDLLTEAFGVFRCRMEDRAAEFALAATTPEAPEVFQQTSEIFQALADRTGQAISDLNLITNWDGKRRVLRK
ncbi:hypothetical protein AB0C87_24905 [Actinomadura sp. NPDC048021]|uniref:hypothetical protein n=1 Tax=Actinomadura sp. NPDC048021 TaxID=3155385 RepID=UPI0034096065